MSLLRPFVELVDEGTQREIDPWNRIDYDFLGGKSVKWKPEKGVQAIFAIVSFFRRSVFDLIVVPVKGLLGDETLQSEGEENSPTFSTGSLSNAMALRNAVL